MPRDLHPKGLFLAEIVNHGFAKTAARPGSTEPGTSYFGVEFHTIIDDETTGQITGFFYLTDKSAEYTVQKIRAMGYEGDDLRELGKEPPILAGNMVKIVVSHHEYAGETRDQVSSVFPKDYEPGLRKDEETTANIGRFNALLARAKVPNGSKKQDAEDDIPF